MIVRLTISVVLLVLALASTMDIFVFIPFGLIVLPVVVGLQIAIEMIARKVTSKKEGVRMYSMIPALAVSLAILLKLSVWVQPYEIFEFTMGSSMPSSVQDFVYEEDSWTDYMVRFYCRISPEDLDRILVGGKFIKYENSERVGLLHAPVEIIIKGRKMEPIVDPVMYYYEINSAEGRSLGECSLTTNSDHNRIYVFYSTD